MSSSSCMGFCRFVAWNIYIVVFSPFQFPGYYFIRLSLCCQWSYWPSPSLFFLIESLSPRIDSSKLSSMLVSSFPPSFLDILCLCHFSDVRPSVSSSTFLSFGLFFWVLSLSVSKRGPEYLARRTAWVIISLKRFLLLNFLSRSFLILLRYSFLNFFFSSLLVWSCSLPIFPSSCNFHVLQAFWF